jgi:hypothetical protein
MSRNRLERARKTIFRRQAAHISLKSTIAAIQEKVTGVCRSYMGVSNRFANLAEIFFWHSRINAFPAQ